MAAPVFANRTTAFVGKIGTDDAGNNPVGSPNAWLTIAAALADIAANYQAATPTAPKAISLEPGVYTTPAFALPPNVFIEADPDAQGGSDGEVIISLTGNVTLSSAWNANAAAIGGFRGVTFRQTTGQNIDLTLPVPAAGNPSRKIYLRDVTTDVDSLSWEATGTGDRLRVDDVIHDGNSGDAVTFSGGTQIINGLESAAIITHDDTGGIAAVVQAYREFVTSAGGGVRFNAVSAGVTARLGASDCRALTLNRTGAATLLVSADAISIPLTANVTYLGTATSANLIPTTDGSGISPVFPFLYLGDGSAALPSLAFATDHTLGLYKFGANVMALAVGGAFSLAFTSGGQIIGTNTGNYLLMPGSGAVTLAAAAGQNVSLLPGAAGNCLIGTAVNTAALLNIGTNTTTAAGGYVLGTDFFFFRSGTALARMSSAQFIGSSVGFTNGAAAALGTLTNAPAAGNPTKWVPVDDNGTTRYSPLW